MQLLMTYELSVSRQGENQASSVCIQIMIQAEIRQFYIGVFSVKSRGLVINVASMFIKSSSVTFNLIKAERPVDVRSLSLGGFYNIVHRD